MPQTLLALAAVLTFSVFALSQHEAKADGDAFAVSSEVELLAGQLARDRLATVLAYRFDEHDVPGGRVRISPEGLTTALGPEGPGDLNDVDDFHGLARPVPGEWMGGALAFTDSVSVRYVGHSGDRLVTSPAPTLMKEVTVTVRAGRAETAGGAAVAATLSQIVSPTSD